MAYRYSRAARLSPQLESIRDLFRAASPEAVTALLGVLRGQAEGTRPSDVVAAAKLLLQWGWGRPGTWSDVSGERDDELAAMPQHEQARVMRERARVLLEGALAL